MDLDVRFVGPDTLRGCPVALGVAKLGKVRDAKLNGEEYSIKQSKEKEEQCNVRKVQGTAGVTLRVPQLPKELGGTPVKPKPLVQTVYP